MADFKGRKKEESHVQNMGIFLVAQDMVLSHRAKFQLIINFFRAKASSTGLLVMVIQSPMPSSLFKSPFCRTDFFILIFPF